MENIQEPERAFQDPAQNNLNAIPPRPARPPEPCWENIPDLLTARHQWVVWRYEWSTKHKRWTKVLYRPNGDHAKSNDASTWSPYEDVQIAYLGPAADWDGVGFCLDSTRFALVGWDFDKCIADGKLDPQIEAWVRRLDSYTEISPSSTGLRVLVRGKKPPQDCRNGHNEVYADGRYLTITGNRWADSPPDIRENQAAIDEVHAELFAERRAKRERSRNQAKPAPGNINLDDKELLDKARAAKNGAKFAALYDRGDWQGQGFSSQSEADLALCGMLAFWTGGDAGRVDSLFRSSGLMRDKWDRDDYREPTIQQALNQSAFYDPTFYDPQAKKAAKLKVVQFNRQAKADKQDPGRDHARGATGEGKPAGINDEEPEPTLPTKYSDIALSNRLVERHGDDMRYIKGEWWVYSAKEPRWMRDELMRVFTWARRLCSDASREAYDAAIANLDTPAKAAAIANKIASAPTVAAVVGLAWKHKKIPALLDIFDRDPWLLNTPDGVVNLKDGTLRPAQREDYFSKVAAVGPAKMATPVFDQFLRDIMGEHIPPEDCKCGACLMSKGKPDDERLALHQHEVGELCAYLKRLYGYCLTADVRTHVLALQIGEGGNGKGVLNDFVSQDILGTSANWIFDRDTDRGVVDLQG